MPQQDIRLFFRLLRWPNLLIVGLTQYLVGFLLLRPRLASAGLPPLLDAPHFALLSLDTMLIAAAGYLINDLLDQETDAANRPERQILGAIWSVRTGWVLYFLFTLAGFGLTLYLGLRTGNLPLVILHPLSTLLLALYSLRWKGLPLLGNLVVALFCALVPGIVLLAERRALQTYLAQSDPYTDPLPLIAGGFLLFSLLTTLYREVIKDLEDLEGDRRAGLRTLPVAWGVPAAKGAALLWATFTLALLLAAAAFEWLRGRPALSVFVQIALLLPLVWSMHRLHRARQRKDYTIVSLVVKMIMVVGLVYLGVAAMP